MRVKPIGLTVGLLVLCGVVAIACIPRSNEAREVLVEEWRSIVEQYLDVRALQNEKGQYTWNSNGPKSFWLCCLGAWMDGGLSSLEPLAKYMDPRALPELRSLLARLQDLQNDPVIGQEDSLVLKRGISFLENLIAKLAQKTQGGQPEAKPQPANPYRDIEK